MNSSNTKPNIAVVGAGIAGLIAAGSLVRKGADVTLFERSQGPGGRAKTLVHEGFYLNLGPHALYRGGTAYKTLSEWGIAPEGSAPKLSGAFALFQKQLYELPTDIFSLLGTKLLSVTDKIELATFLVGLPKLNTAALLNASFESWLRQSMKSERARLVMEALVRLSTYANAGAHLSAGAAMKQLALGNSDGVIYIDHGWQSIIDSLNKLVTDKLKFRTSEAVIAIKESGQNIELSIEDEKHVYDAVILAVPPDEVSRITGAEFSETLIRGRIACLDVCLKSLPNKQNTFALGMDEPLYYSVHSKSADLAPTGMALIHLGYYLKPDEESSAFHQERLLKLLEQLQPGWQTELVFKRFLPDMVASYGIPLTRNSEFPTSSLSRVFTCGDWADATRLHFLADASATSALQAAKAAIEICGKVAAST